MITEILWGVCLVVGVATGNMLIGLGVMLVCVAGITAYKVVTHD